MLDLAGWRCGARGAPLDDDWAYELYQFQIESADDVR
jgi:hypothetical protein